MQLFVDDFGIDDTGDEHDDIGTDDAMLLVARIMKA